MVFFKKLFSEKIIEAVIKKFNGNLLLELFVFKGMLGKYEDGLSYAKQGIAIVSQILDDDVPFHYWLDANSLYKHGVFI